MYVFRSGAGNNVVVNLNVEYNLGGYSCPKRKLKAENAA
jgi:hypothetical protein